MSVKCEKWLDKNKINSPALVIDLENIIIKYRIFESCFTNIKAFYAIKANPDYRIIKTLNNLGCKFDAASINEIKKAIKTGVKAKNISYGNTIKKSKDIASAYQKGIRLYVFDSKEELYKIAKNAPKSKVFCRIQVSNGGAEWPLTKKFGCNANIANELLLEALELGLKPIGLSFHVGSQQINPQSWDKGIKVVSEVYSHLLKKGMQIKFLNLGGGLPLEYSKKIPSINIFASCIKKSLKKYFLSNIPSDIIMEPGRFLVGEAGVIETEIVLVSKRNYNDNHSWIYIDVGRFNGLVETEGEAIRYKFKAVGYGENVIKSKYKIAGPSCDGLDILYEKNLYELPAGLKAGDKLRILCTGAYTSVYKTDFNGIENPVEKFLEL